MPALTAQRRRNAIKTATAASARIHIGGTGRNASGRPIRTGKTLTRKEERLLKEYQESKETERQAALSAAQREREDRIRDVPEPYDEPGGASFEDYEDDVLHGRLPADISHAGEDLTEDEVQDADRSLLDELRAHHNQLFPRARDYRTRRNRTQKLVNAFAEQLEPMADVYIKWNFSVANEGLAATYTLPEGSIVQETRSILVVDMFSSYQASIDIIQGDANIAAAFVRQGLMPISPYLPSVVITIRALEAYRVAHLRCPRLGIQAWVRALCDIHDTAPRSYLGTQFSIAFDLYLAVRAIVDKRVQQALGRDEPNWRLKNACPCCLYKLEGEDELAIPILATIDGNNSLKRFMTRERDGWDEEGEAVTGALKERADDRVAPGDYYLSREEVDRWAKEGFDDMMKGFVAGEDWVEEEDGCAERWQNMKEEVTARALGMYDETGFFPALCRHSFVLIVADMVKSGELGKYGFAVANHLLRVLGKLGLGYDIGCKFGKMVRAHPGLTELARNTGFKSLVGAFHGGSHGRRCQVVNLTTYVPGVGMESLEECETYFSKSNALAPGTRHATRFHRQQAITTYLKHTDTFDSYANLALLLCSKYRRALNVKKTLPALQSSMRRLGVESRAVFEMWLEKEKQFLATLSKEPIQETLEMEYYQKLVNLRDHENRVNEILALEPPPAPPPTDAGAYQRAAKETRAIETRRRHAIELYSNALDAVQDLERRLDVTERWAPGSDKWETAATMVGKRRYQRALDELEGLIISRIFELSKVNMAGTAYKIRKHIAKALQARSKAVKTAIERYNAAADSMIPPKINLSWDEVVEYAFISDFDLLREGREDIREEPWALPAGRIAMDQHYKLLRADEEITRLNLEIQRLVTYMPDEEAFLVHQEERLCAEGDDALAYQVQLLRMERGRFNAQHMDRLVKLSKETGFTGCISPGVSVCKERHVRAAPDLRRRSAPQDIDAVMRDYVYNADLAPVTEGSDEEEDEDEDELAEAFANVLRIATDGARTAAA